MLILSVLVTLILFNCATPSHADSVTIRIEQESIKADQRLERPVTISVRRAPLKSVLDQLSAQTGIAIAMDDRDLSSGYPVQVECRDTPVYKIVKSLYSLVSIKGGEWAWSRSGKPGEYRYVFHETPWAKNRQDAYNRIASDILHNFVSVMKKLAPMTMSQRYLHRLEVKRALYMEDDEMVDALFQNDRFWTEANFFFEALSLAQQEAVMRGATIEVELKSLPPETYALYHKIYIESDTKVGGADGVLRQIPELDVVKVMGTGPNAKQANLSPMIEVNDASGAKLSFMGTGHLQFGIRDAIKNMWTLPNDSLDDPVGQAIVKEPKQTDEIRGELQTITAQDKFVLEHSSAAFVAQHPLGTLGTPLGFTLAEVAQGSSVPVVAMLPANDQRRFGSPVGKTVQSYMRVLEGKRFKTYFFKWCDGVLLVNTPDWFIDPVQVIPSSLWASLHPDKNGHVPVLELANLMNKTSEDQAQWFAKEVKMQHFELLRLCLLQLANEPRLLSNQGVILEPETAKCIVPSNIQMPTDPHTRYRMRELENGPGEGNTTRLRVEALSPEQEQWQVLSVLQLPQYVPASAPAKAAR